MTPEVKARLFEPFFSTREIGKGTGLGLASIYGAVVQSGGSISVQSVAGRGTTFQIYLPGVQPEKSAAEVATDRRMGAHRGTGTILLVEDQAPLLHLERNFLERLGYKVLPAGHPEEAIRICREFSGVIHLLLTDVVMPGMNGRELARQLCAQRPDLRVLYVSGFADQAFEESGMPAAVEVLEKPFAFEELESKLREIL